MWVQYRPSLILSNTAGSISIEKEKVWALDPDRAILAILASYYLALSKLLYSKQIFYLQNEDNVLLHRAAVRILFKKYLKKIRPTVMCFHGRNFGKHIRKALEWT